ENYNSNLLIETPDGKRLLLDCGADARHSLHRLGYDYKDIDAVYISHLHSDHIGGLEWLAINRKFNSNNKDKPDLYARHELIDDLWNKSLSGGLMTVANEIPTLATYFNPYPISEKGIFVWENITFQTVQTVHIISGFALMPSFGLAFTLGKTKILFTSD